MIEVKYIIRNILKSPTSIIVNVVGLTLGLTCFLFILIWIKDEKSYEKFFKNAGSIYRIVETQYYDGAPFPVAVTPVPLAQELKKKYPEVVKASFCERWEPVIKIDERTYKEVGIYVDKDFLDIFDFSYLYGNPLTALTEKDNVIITDELAEKYFKTGNPIGKTITFDSNRQLKVSAVIRKLPQNTMFQFKMIANAESFIDNVSRNDWGSNRLMTFILLNKDTQIADFNKKIKKTIMASSNDANSADIEAQSLTDIHLYSAGKYTADYDGLGDIFYVNILTLVAIFIILIACINFMNLSTAQFSKRSRESGLKKILGTGKKEIMRNLLGESTAIALIALMISLCLFRILLPEFENISGKHFALEQFTNFHFVAFLIAIIVGIISGIYPAVFYSSVDPIHILKGKFRTGKSNLRQVLIVFQFFISITFIIGTLVVTRQIQFIKDQKLGINKENMLHLWMSNDFSRSFQTAKEELLKNPGILNVTRGNQLPTSFVNSTSGLEWEGKDPKKSYLFHYENVDEDYQKTFGIEMKDGRFFSKAFNDDNSIVINEKAAGIMNLKEPVGSVLHGGNQTIKIIGVIRDFHFKSLHHKIEPLILLYPSGGQAMFIRTKSADATNTIDYIKKVYDKFESNKPFEYGFLDKDYEFLYRSEQRMGKLFGYFSFFAIFISCIGLFGLTIFTMQNRVKEIGIRKVNGGKVSEVMAMLNKDFVKWVTIAFVIAVPVAWYAMHRWLQNYSYKISLSWWIFALAGAMALGIALLTVSWQSWKAATRNPVEALRCE